MWLNHTRFHEFSTKLLLNTVSCKNNSDSEEPPPKNFFASGSLVNFDNARNPNIFEQLALQTYIIIFGKLRVPTRNNPTIISLYRRAQLSVQFINNYFRPKFCMPEWIRSVPAYAVSKTKHIAGGQRETTKAYKLQSKVITTATALVVHDTITSRVTHAAKNPVNTASLAHHENVPVRLYMYAVPEPRKKSRGFAK